MNGQHILGTPIVVDFWRLRDVPPRALFFLTHMHADHTSGLSAFWPYPIHCSPITARLLRRKFNVDPKLVVEMEVGESRILHVNCPGDHVTVTVTTLDADHCPGSAMFLFEGYFGSILYTGDFRFSPFMLTHPLLNGSRTIDVLYLDNTYCHPSCQFPPREEVTDLIISVIRDNPEYLYVIGLHNLGKEDLLVAIATELQTWVGVSPERYETLKQLEMPAVFSTEPGACQINVYPFHMVAKNMLAEVNSTAIAILPTCLFSGAGAPQPPSNPRIKVFPYSDHSSYDELQQFVASVRPRCVRPVVRKFSGDRQSIFSRCNMDVFGDLLDPNPPHEVEVPAAIQRLLTMKSHDQATPVQPKTQPLILRRRSSLTYSASRTTKSKAKGVQFISPVKKRSTQEVEDGGSSEDKTEERTDNCVESSKTLEIKRARNLKAIRKEEKSNPAMPVEKCRYKPLVFKPSDSPSQVETAECTSGNPNSVFQDRPVLEDGLTAGGSQLIAVDVLADPQCTEIELESQHSLSELNFVVQVVEGNVQFDTKSPESELNFVIETVQGNVEMSLEEEEGETSSQSENSGMIPSRVVNEVDSTVAQCSGIGGDLSRKPAKRKLPATVLPSRPKVSPFMLWKKRPCCVDPAQPQESQQTPQRCMHLIRKEHNPLHLSAAAEIAENLQSAEALPRVGEMGNGTPDDVEFIHSPEFTQGGVSLLTPARPSNATYYMDTVLTPSLPQSEENEMVMMRDEETPLPPARTLQDAVSDIAVSSALARKIPKNTRQRVKTKAKAKAVPRYQGPLCLCTTSSKSHNVCLVGIEEFFDHSSTLNTMTGTEFDQEFDQWVIDL